MVIDPVTEVFDTSPLSPYPRMYYFHTICLTKYRAMSPLVPGFSLDGRQLPAYPH